MHEEGKEVLRRGKGAVAEKGGVPRIKKTRFCAERGERVRNRTLEGLKSG
jgi:hypothetical protein